MLVAITQPVWDLLKLVDYPVWVKILGLIWLFSGVGLGVSVLFTKPKTKEPLSAPSAITHGENSHIYQAGRDVQVTNITGLSAKDTKLMEDLLKKLNASDDPEDRSYPGLAFFLVCSFNEQTELRRKFIFDFGTSRDRARFSAYLTEDNALAFRVIDQTGETNTIRVPRSDIDMKTFSGWLFEIGKVERKSFLRISRNGRRLQSAIVNYPIDASVFQFGAMASFSDMDGKNNGSGAFVKQGVFNRTLTSSEQLDLVRREVGP